MATMATNFFNPVYSVYNEALSNAEQKRQYEATNSKNVTQVFDKEVDAENWGEYVSIPSATARLAAEQRSKHQLAINTELTSIPKSQPNAKTWHLANDHYRMERIDVQHRMGDYLVKAWEEYQKITGIKNANFWQWVSAQSADEDKVKSWNPELYARAQQNHPAYISHYLEWFRKGVKYVKDGQDRDRYWVEVKDGQLWRKLQKANTERDLFDTEAMIAHIRQKHPMSLTAIWVLSPAKKFYSHVVKIGRFHHSSFLEGTEIRAAGEWGVKKGKLMWINGKSGHYRPELARFIDGLRRLSKLGVADSDAKVRLYKTGQPAPLEEPLATFLKNVEANAQHYTAQGFEIFS